MEINTNKYYSVFDLFKTEVGLPKPIKYPHKVSTIVVHDGSFHMDDVLFVALVKTLINPDIQIIRTRWNPANGIPDNIPEDAIIADVGNIYDGERLYDHHQIEYTDRDSDNQKRSAVGLFWDDWGDAYNYPLLAQLISAVNRHDNNIAPSLICSIVAASNSIINDEEHNDAAFYSALRYCIDTVNRCVLVGVNSIKIFKMLDNTPVINGILQLPFYIDNCKFYVKEYGRKCIKRIKGYTYVYPKTNVRYIHLIGDWYFPSDWRFNPPEKTVMIKSQLVKTLLIDYRQLTDKLITRKEKI